MYEPFQSKTNWGNHDVEVIEDCFIGPQSVLTNKLIAYIMEKKLESEEGLHQDYDWISGWKTMANTR